MERICRRCLLRELSGDEAFRGIYEYIDSLPAEARAPQELYNRRLALCRGCSDLVNGMCGQCGCFVEVRAAKLRSHCAKSDSIW